MRTFSWEFWATCALVCGVMALGLVLGCSGEVLRDVRDASSKREIVCEFVQAAPDNATVRAAKEACARGEDLEAIARAYGGCEP